MKNMKLLKADTSLFSLTDSNGKMNLFALAIPLFFQQIFNILLGTVNTVVLTYVSDDAVTAVNVANTVLNIPIILLMMSTQGLLILLSFALGRGDESTGDLYITSVAANVGLSIIVSIILCIAAPLFMQMMNLSGDVALQAVKYFRIRSVFLIFQALTTCLTSVLRAHGFAKSTMVSGIITNAVNAGLSALVVSNLIFASDKIAGVAFAAVLGQIAGLVYAYIALRFNRQIERKGKVRFVLLRKMLQIGVPSGLSLLMYNVSTMVSTAILTSLGTQILRTKIYVANIANFGYLFGYAIAQSAALMIGRHNGAGKYNTAKKLFHLVAFMVPLLNAAFALIIFINSDYLMKIFKADEQMMLLAHTIFLIDIAVEIARGNTHVGENALCSVGDTMYTSIVSIISCIFINILGCWLFCLKFGLGVYGYYIVSLLDEGTRGVLYHIRWNKGAWTEKLKSLYS